MRSHKSTSKPERTRIIDVSRTVRRRLNMSTSIPDVVQTSQQPLERDDDDEFFLSKNSKLFSQVESNTLKQSDESQKQQQKLADYQVVEVKAMEIVKANAAASSASGDRLVLPRANFSVQQVPQVRLLFFSVCRGFYFILYIFAFIIKT